MESPLWYEIRIAGHLGALGAAAFPGLTVRLDPNGETVLAGKIVDQAALHGILMRIRDLGLPLLSVSCRETEPVNDAAARAGATGDDPLPR